MSATPLMPVEEALERVLASIAAPTEREAVALAEAYGRTLASDVASRRVQPPFANSAMDGYALRAADAARPPARLTVVGESAAGRPFAGRRGPGEAARIFTGAPLPEGADAVAMQENARREGETVILIAPVAPGDHVRAPGGDFGAGEIVLRAGRRLSARRFPRTNFHARSTRSTGSGLTLYLPRTGRGSGRGDGTDSSTQSAKPGQPSSASNRSRRTDQLYQIVGMTLPPLTGM